ARFNAGIRHVEAGADGLHLDPETAEPPLDADVAELREFDPGEVQRPDAERVDDVAVEHALDVPGAPERCGGFRQPEEAVADAGDAGDPLQQLGEGQRAAGEELRLVPRPDAGLAVAPRPGMEPWE